MNSREKHLTKQSSQSLPHNVVVEGLQFICFLLVSCYAFFRSSLLRDRSFGIWQDNEFSLSPVLHSLSTLNHSTIIPNYLPQFLGGIDLQGYAQFSPAYPLYFLGFSLFSTPLSAIASINLLVHLHLVIYLSGAYFLLRTLRISVLASMVGAIFIVFNSNTLNYSSWLNIIAPYSWLPWILGFLIVSLRSGRFLYWSLFYICSGLMFLASPAQPVIHTVYLVTILAISHFYLTRKNALDRIQVKKSLKKAVVLAPIFLMVLLPFLFPLLNAAKKQIRWIGDFGTVSGFDKIPFEAFQITQVEFREISGFLLESVSPREVGGIYFGPVLISLILYGFFKLKRDYYWRVFCIIGFYSLISAFGENLGFSHLNYNLPLINAIREPSRFLVLSHLCFGICSGLAVNDIYQNLNRIMRNQRHHFTSKVFLNSGNIVIVILFVLVIFTQPKAINWAAPSVSTSDYNSQNWKDFEIPMKVLQSLDPKSEYRIIFGGDINSQQASMFAAFFGLRTLNTYMNPLPEGQFNAMYFYDNHNYRYKELLGAKYLVCSLACPIKDSERYFNYLTIWKNEKYRILENSKADAFLTLPSQVLIQNGIVEGLSYMVDESFDAFVLDSRSTNPNKIFADCKFLNSTHRGFQKIEANVECSSKGFLILNAYNDGNWTAKNNKKTTTPMVANGFLVGIRLEPGMNSIQIQHEAKDRNLVVNVSLISAGMYLLFLLIKNRKVLHVKYAKLRSNF